MLSKEKMLVRRFYEKWIEEDALGLMRQLDVVK